MFLRAGKGQAFLSQFFKQIGSGAFGPIDLSKTVVCGWSGGTQMVSWMMQVMARQSQLTVNIWVRDAFCYRIPARMAANGVSTEVCDHNQRCASAIVKRHSINTPQQPERLPYMAAYNIFSLNHAIKPINKHI